MLDNYPSGQSIAKLSKTQGQLLCGQYRVMNVSARAGSSGAFFQIELADYSGSLQVHAQLDGNPEVTSLRPGNLIQATLRTRSPNGQIVATLERFRMISAAQVINAATLIPQSEVPRDAQGALAALVACITRLSRAESRQFMRRLLTDPSVYRPLVTAPAGKSFHHAYAGGLLVHTVGCMQKAEAMTRWVYAKGAAATDLALLGGFVHDLGKIRTLGGEACETLCHRMRHEVMTVAVIAEPLREMATSWAYGAERLGELVDWLSLPNTHRKKRLRLGDLVHWADALDVMADRQEGSCAIPIRHAAFQARSPNSRALI